MEEHLRWLFCGLCGLFPGSSVHSRYWYHMITWLHVPEIPRSLTEYTLVCLHVFWKICVWQDCVKLTIIKWLKKHRTIINMHNYNTQSNVHGTIQFSPKIWLPERYDCLKGIQHLNVYSSSGYSAGNAGPKSPSISFSLTFIFRRSI